MQEKEKLVGAVLCRNEAGRYLKRAIENLKTFCDDVLVVDDNSTDDSVRIAKQAGAIVISLPSKGYMWGKETPARAFLWQEAVKLAGAGWIYFADADHITRGNLKELTKSWVLNAWAFPLFDVWDEDETLFRADGYWQGHRHPRIWMVRPSAVPEGWEAQWAGRGIHAGHIPANFPIHGVRVPDDFYILHLGYARADDRVARHSRYLEVKDQMTEFERAHAATILD